MAERAGASGAQAAGPRGQGTLDQGPLDQGPLEECDIIMRGGITSGVVYPGVLVALSRSYRFRNIGGASAGAIAAGVAAAAEYGRRSGKRTDAFESVVAGLPEELGGSAKADGRLGTDFRTIFRPAAPLAPLLDIGWTYLGGGAWLAGIAAFLGRLLAPILRPAVATAAAAALLAALLGFVMVVSVAGGFSLASVIFGLIVALTFAALTACLLLPLLLLQDRRGLGEAFSGPLASLKSNGFGLCPGVNPALGLASTTADFVEEGGFADWMHATIQRAAGRDVQDLPLLMSDLWGADDAWSGAAPGTGRAIDLMFTTTNLSQQLPHQFPFLERTGSILWFAEEDLQDVLPAPVLAYMLGLFDMEGPDRTEGRRAFYQNSPPMIANGRRYYRLPMPQDMPVLLGVRLSMSFPGLISAVQLHESAAWEERRGTDIASTLKPCWFSDGGITSNFPVTSFDAPLPSRPTFCINLADLPPREGRNTSRRIVMVENNSQHIRALYRSRLDDLPGFLNAIVDTARNGRENELMTMPGHRDRIVTIRLDPKREGGLNLDMDAQTIRRLSCLGLKAGRMLAERFTVKGPAKGMGWANHRWVRLRITLAGAEGLLVRFDEGWRRRHADGMSFETLLGSAQWNSAPSYQWLGKQAAQEAAARVGQLRDLAESLAAAVADRPDRSVWNGVRKRPNDRGSLSRDGAAPQPAMGFELRPIGRDPRRS